MFKCRCCGSSFVQSIIPLGKLPLANALLSSVDNIKEQYYNLEVMLCENCGLAQLRDLIDPKNMFSEYVYFSSNSDTMLKSAADLVEKTRPKLQDDALIIEIASNDGYLLKNYVKNNIKVLGIDPAQNIAKVANENGIFTLCEFFGVDLAFRLAEEGKKADVVHANNVMAHVPEINGFIKGIKHILKHNGQAIIEVPYFFDLIKKLEFDTIYHEHVFYFTVKSLKFAFQSQGLEIFDIEKIAIHGGTLRLFVGHAGVFDIKPIINVMIDEEVAFGLSQLETYEHFMHGLQKLHKQLHQILGELKLKKLKIAAYGASAKGTTLLNFFGIDSNYLDFVVDKSIVKQDLYTPGTHLKIKAPKALQEEAVDYALLLTWNFAEEIIEQQQPFVQNNGKFIIPLPEVRVVP